MEDQSLITHGRVKEMEDPRGQGAHGKLEGKGAAAVLKMQVPPKITVPGSVVPVQGWFCVLGIGQSSPE